MKTCSAMYIFASGILMAGISSCANDQDAKAEAVSISVSFISKSWDCDAQKLINSGDLSVAVSSIENGEVVIIASPSASYIVQEKANSHERTQLTIKVKNGQVIECM